ncbi:MAG: type I DNA topoisomerase, partial [Candidatus Cloacimonetes bacterium]|nr:type I DNA topoisomerase [Candidatus Cloacimonadota bacterium]
MSKNLIIVESPAKAKTIGKFLGNQYTIKASMGHVRDLPQKSLGVDVKNNFKPQYVTDPRKKKVIVELQEAAEKASHIYLAPDHDREGEAIAWHLVQVLGNGIKDKPIHRIVFNEITRSAIQQALSNPGDIDENKVNSQQARRILDRIVGYNISPLLWRVLTKNLSAGRVQSVALRLICEREAEIDSFQPQEYWSLEAVLYRDQLPPFRATLQKWAGSKVDIKEGVAAGEIKKQLDQQQFILSNISDGSKKVQPLPPFITSSLQQDAARLFNFSAKKTMMIAQQLYEGIEVAGETAGLITYMRTDSLRIAGEALDNVRKLVRERFGEQELIAKARLFKNKNRTQDAHEAIRPTDCFRTPEAVSNFLNKEQLKLYTLIWQRFVATQMQPVKLHTRTFEITAGPGIFSCSGSTVTEQGFALAYPHIKLILGEKLHPDYRINDPLAVKEMDALQHFTKPPVRYTEASLIKELETLGIGRPSTYA